MASQAHSIAGSSLWISTHFEQNMPIYKKIQLRGMLHTVHVVWMLSAHKYVHILWLWNWRTPKKKKKKKTACIATWAWTNFDHRYSLVQWSWNWFSDVTGCTRVTCIQWCQKNQFHCNWSVHVVVSDQTTLESKAFALGEILVGGFHIVTFMSANYWQFYALTRCSPQIWTEVDFHCSVSVYSHWV